MAAMLKKKYPDLKNSIRLGDFTKEIRIEGFSIWSSIAARFA